MNWCAALGYVCKGEISHSPAYGQPFTLWLFANLGVLEELDAVGGRYLTAIEKRTEDHAKSGCSQDSCLWTGRNTIIQLKLILAIVIFMLLPLQSEV